MKDAYEIFLKEFCIDRDKLIEFGIRETISIKITEVEAEWENLKNRISGTIPKPVHIRGSGRDAKTTALYLDLYKTIFPKGTFVKDSTNNAAPKRLLEVNTKCKRGKTATFSYEQLMNYQVSHIFGRTKNPFTFTAPWNVVYLPKIMDPFTGHESSGEIKKVFSGKFKEHFIEKYISQIHEFNSIMNDVKPKIELYVSNVDTKFNIDDYTQKMLEKFKVNVLKEFEPIPIPEFQKMT